MAGLFVTLPRGQQVFYSCCVHQLTGLPLSHPSSWHWALLRLSRARKQRCLGSQGYQVLFPGDCPALAMSTCPLLAPLAKKNTK